MYSFTLPIVYAVETFHKVIQDAIKEVFTFIPKTVNKAYRFFALLYSRSSIATKADPLNPLDFCQQLRRFGSNKACVKGLVEVDTVAAADDFLNLFNAVVTGKDVVVKEDEVCPTLDSDFVNVHVRPYAALFLRHYAPLAMVRATSRQKTVCRLAVYIWILQWFGQPLVRKPYAVLPSIFG